MENNIIFQQDKFTKELIEQILILQTNNENLISEYSLNEYLEDANIVVITAYKNNLLIAKSYQ